MISRRLLSSAALAAALLALPLGAAPTVPALVNYQGYVTNAQGAALADGNYDILFKIYTAASGGTPIWGEKQVVTLNGGQFSVLLGNGGAIDVATPRGALSDLFIASPLASGNLFMGLTVNPVGQNTNAEFTPRQQILANPFAHRALRADVATAVADGVIVTNSLADSSISSAKIANNTIVAADLASNAVTTLALANGSVTTDKLATGAVTNVKLSAGAVTSASIFNGTVASEDLAPGAVNSSIIADGGVATVDIAPGAVTVDKLAAGAIGASQIADGSITTAKLANLAVTEAKIANASITGAKLVNDTVTPAQVSFADGTTDINLFSSSGTGGTFLNMSSAAATVRSGSTIAYPSRVLQTISGVNVMGGTGLSRTVISNPFGGNLTVLALRMAVLDAATGNPVNGSALLGTTGEWSSSSDIRMKKDIHPAGGMLEKSMKLKPSWFRFKNGDAQAPESLGFIAQEVNEVLPSLVNRNADHWTLNYAGMSTVAIGAVQEQQALIEKQAERITRLESENAALAKRLERLEAALQTMAAQ
jgi:hypothetical protein